MLEREEVIKIAKLSKIRFDENDIENFRSDLNSILDYVEELNEIDTSNIEPLFNVLDLKDKLREDIVLPSQDKKEFLENAPLSDENFIIVPKIIENK